MILINCDIGERGAKHPIDMKLMSVIGMANIACGGHAGDQDSVDFYLDLCKKYNVIPTAHLSYPDKENFGRVSVDISFKDLDESLTEQYKLMAHVKAVKFHGALYNDVSSNKELAEFLSAWLLKNGIKTVVTPFDSELANSCKQKNIKICTEAFAERRYYFNPESKRLNLVPRSKDYASIHNCKDAVEHSKKIVFEGKVNCVENGLDKVVEFPIKAETICIHSDSKIAFELALELKGLEG